MNEIINKADKIILKLANNKEFTTLNLEIDLVNDLMYDSISLISLVVELENEFKITLPDDFITIDNLKIYKNLLDTVIGLSS